MGFFLIVALKAVKNKYVKKEKFDFILNFSKKYSLYLQRTVTLILFIDNKKIRTNENN